MGQSQGYVFFGCKISAVVALRNYTFQKKTAKRIILKSTISQELTWTEALY